VKDRQTFPDLHNNYVLEGTVQIGIEYTYGPLYMYIVTDVEKTT